MSTIGKIRSYLASRDREHLLTTRDLLGLGTRSAVDNAVSRLVYREELIRIIPGVFRLPGRTRKVSLHELATVKAKSFGRTIIRHAADIAFELDISAVNRPENEVWFATSGNTSSFRIGHLTVRFKPTSHRKMTLADTPFGQVVRALCYLGKERVSPQLFLTATRNLRVPLEKSEGHPFCYLPAWLGDMFYCLGPRPGSPTDAVRESTIGYIADSRTPDRVFNHTLLISLAPRAPGSMGLGFQYQKSALSRAREPCPRKEP